MINYGVTRTTNWLDLFNVGYLVVEARFFDIVVLYIIKTSIISRGGLLWLRFIPRLSRGQFERDPAQNYHLLIVAW
jgi:hypothetical protein